MRTRWRPITAFGKLSYETYLIHLPVILAVRDLPEEAELLRWIAHQQDLAGIGLIRVQVSPVSFVS